MLYNTLMIYCQAKRAINCIWFGLCRGFLKTKKWRNCGHVRTTDTWWPCLAYLSISGPRRRRNFHHTWPSRFLSPFLLPPKSCSGGFSFLNPYIANIYYHNIQKPRGYRASDEHAASIIPPYTACRFLLLIVPIWILDANTTLQCKEDCTSGTFDN